MKKTAFLLSLLFVPLSASLYVALEDVVLQDTASQEFEFSPEALKALSITPRIYTDNSQRLALEGYDPVSYFFLDKPQVGLISFSFFWQGAHWRFENEENKENFQNDPEKYAPQFGGYCPWALSQGWLVGGLPHLWQVVNGKLYLLSSSLAMQKWIENRDQLNRIADVRWLELNS